MEFYQRIEQFGKRVLLVVLATILTFSVPGCVGLTETGKYAKQLNLPEETIAIVNELNYETNTIALLDEISCLPEHVQTNEQFLNYLKQIAADKQVTDDELVRFKEMIGLGLDTAVVDYLLLLSSLKDQDFAQYALESKLCIKDRNLTELEIRFINEPDNYSQELFNYYGSEVNNINPELASELTKLPDFQVVDVKNIEALEDILWLTTEARYQPLFELMLKEGVPEKRKYCAPLEAMIWLLYDTDDLPSYSSVEDLVIAGWLSSTSDLYDSSRWEKFEEVVDRLQSPCLVAIYMVANLGYDLAMRATLIGYGRGWLSLIRTPEQIFQQKLAICTEHSRFALYCLLQNGYSYDEFEANRDKAACIFEACDESLPTSPHRHAVCLYIKQGNFYTIDDRSYGFMEGPFRTIEEAADLTFHGWKSYKFYDLDLKVTKRGPKSY